MLYWFVLSARAAPRNGYLSPHNRSQDQED
jgi:hypothetical protein